MVKVVHFQLWLLAKAEKRFIWALSLRKIHLASISLEITLLRRALTYHVWLIQFCRHYPNLLFGDDFLLLFTRILFHLVKHFISSCVSLVLIGKSTLDSVILQTTHGRLIYEGSIFLLNDALIWFFLVLDLGQYIIGFLMRILDDWDWCFWLIYAYFLWIAAYKRRFYAGKNEIIDTAPQNVRMFINRTLRRKVLRVV